MSTPPNRSSVLLAGLLSLGGCQNYELNKVADGTEGAPQVRVSPDHLDFSGLDWGEILSETVLIENEGDTTLSVHALDVTGSGTASYTLLADPLPLAILPGGRTAVEVVYTAVTTSAEASLYVRSDDPSSPDVPVALSGTPVYGMLAVSPNPIDFGNTAPGHPTEADAVARNVGTGPVTVSTIALLGEPFSLLSAPATPWALAPGDSVPLTLQYAPEEEGLSLGELWLTADDAAGAQVVWLLGSAGIAVEEGEVPDDRCYEPRYGWEEAPGARLYIDDASEPVIVTYLGTDAGYTNELWLTAPDDRHLATGHEDSPGVLTPLGPYGAGTELLFAIHVRDTGEWFYSGPGEGNPDGRIHASTIYRGDCTWSIGFEDLYGGGDQDYDDIMLLIEGRLRQR